MIKDVGRLISLIFFSSVAAFLTVVFFVVAKFAQEVVKPKVSQMDESEKLDASVLKGLFDQGVSNCNTGYGLTAY
jgi:hypothetical protein